MVYDNHEIPPRAIDVGGIRRDFPILSLEVHGRPLVYFDNAATTQKPQAVLDAMRRYYETRNANVYRGIHFLSEAATADYEGAREVICRFLGASSVNEVVFTRGATEGINLVAQTYGRMCVGPGDEILVSAMEHHSNIVPWQMLAEAKGARLRVIPITDDGDIDFDAYRAMLTARTRIVAVTHISNVLGTVNPVEPIAASAHAAGAVVLVDGAQSAPHMPIDVQKMGCDFYVCSGHKTYGPTGIGVLFGRAALLDAMPPWQGGGGSILSVSFEKTRYAGVPARFEPGTPHVAGAVGLAAGIEYMQAVGLEHIEAYETDLANYAVRTLAGVPGVRVLGRPTRRAGIVSFVVDGIHAHDVSQILDSEGVAVRAGHHCAQPLMERLGVPTTVRASFSFYNTRGEIDVLAGVLAKVKEVFGE